MHAWRLTPGQDLRQALEAWVQSEGIRAAAMVTCVGSLARVRLRLADETQQLEREGPFEIVSLVGTLGQAGLHLHISLADRTGQVIGGHLLPGCIVHTTAELICAKLPELAFHRVVDAHTGFRELQVERQPGP